VTSSRYQPDHSSEALKHLHAVLTVAWLVFAVPVLLMPGWKESVALLVFISIYANVAGHASAWQASRTEEKQDEKS
jgi:hypothetical protein